MFMYLKLHRFAIMFAHALLLDLSMVVPSCMWDEADNCFSKYWSAITRLLLLSQKFAIYELCFLF